MKRRGSKRTTKKRQRSIQFVNEEDVNIAGSNAVQKSIFDTGSDWVLRVDLRKKLVFPDIVTTTLGPDMVKTGEETDSSRTDSAMGGEL